MNTCRSRNSANEESYHIEYPCPGQPELAERIHRQLNSAGIQANLDKKHGFDHGLFVALKIMFPNADIPCVQLSLLNNLDPEQHIVIGESFHDLGCDNLLVIGSGFSFHNMKQFFAPETIDSTLQNESFDSWLIETCSSSNIDEKDRRLRLINWGKAPAARVSIDCKARVNIGEYLAWRQDARRHQGRRP
ncbi:MAG: dioxygenase [Candidatus Competibacteraceae bacterium]|nr:dioxygenase [Candidatus Competibacteraceae bacterium]